MTSRPETRGSDLLPGAPAATEAAGQPRPADPRTVLSGTSRARRWADRAGRDVVRVGGFLIIASILGILLFIVSETLPLLRGARVAPGTTQALAAAAGAAVMTDEYRSRAVALDRSGRLVSVDLAGGTADEMTLPPPAPPLGGADAFTYVGLASGRPAFLAGAPDGRVFFVPLSWTRAAHDVETRVSSARPDAPVVLEADPRGRAVTLCAGSLADDGGAAVAARLADGTLVLVRRSVETNALTGESSATLQRHEIGVPGVVEALAVDDAGRNLWAGLASGEVVHWAVPDGGPGAPTRVATPAPVTALGFLIGQRSVVSGHADGTLRVWLLVREDGGARRPRAVREFDGAGAPVREIAASPRDKGFLVLDGAGRVGLYHSTSHRTLWVGDAPVAGAQALAFAPKADGAIVLAPGRAAELRIDNPHPDVSLEALFARVWYEGYDEPAFVWQSSSGTDDFEPKLSLTPLLVGTLKGTFYSLILAIPLGVLGAMYTSQFMHHRLKQIVKPVVEIMASLPSVVLGFLAGLWLAPRIERFFPALILMLVLLPAMAILASGAYRYLPLAVRGRLPTGSEALLAIGFLAAGIFIAVALEGPFARLVFEGRFQTWLSATSGLTYDQRNAIVVGIAMGFAVIPIIFSVAEEAFSNVPRGLVAGSLALGASRWQTVTRVVLPSASPGIFSAIMIGFGRAVGETMIVLMATGNTPIMDWSPFNGFRTLSANIAVEIPEAARGATLYRTLFLAGLLLFVLTFAVNTAAEIVRQNLRRLYSNL